MLSQLFFRFQIPGVKQNFGRSHFIYLNSVMHKAQITLYNHEGHQDHRERMAEFVCTTFVVFVIFVVR